MSRITLPALLLAVGLIVASCADSINAADMSIGSKTSVQSLGITAFPITAEQARQIAEKETGGVAIEVDTDKEDGVAVFDVRVRLANETKTEFKEVVIRTSDGAVLSTAADDANSDSEGDSEGDSEASADSDG